MSADSSPPSRTGSAIPLEQLIAKWLESAEREKQASREANHDGKQELDAYRDGKAMAFEECASDLDALRRASGLSGGLIPQVDLPVEAATILRDNVWNLIDGDPPAPAGASEPWLPIEGAPRKPGARFLVCSPAGVGEAQVPANEEWGRFHTLLVGPFTHWMPLPEPPAARAVPRGVPDEEEKAALVVEAVDATRVTDAPASVSKAAPGDNPSDARRGGYLGADLSGRSENHSQVALPPPARTPECTGPFAGAFDCPVHDPRKQAPTRTRAGLEAWRLDADGGLDDVVVPDVETFRLERMGLNKWWIGLYRADGRLEHIDLYWQKGGGITASRREEPALAADLAPSRPLDHPAEE